MNRQQVIYGGIWGIAVMLLCSVAVIVHWSMVLGLPLGELDPMAFLVPGLVAIILAVCCSRRLCSGIADPEKRSARVSRQPESASGDEVMNMVNPSLFARALVHDLRGPVNVIKGFSEEVLEAPACTPDTCIDRMQRINRAAGRMDNIIKGMMRLCEVGRQRLSRDIVDVTRLSAEVIACLRESDPAATVQVEIQPGMRVHADPALMYIAMSNLIGNAWKFSRKREAAMIGVRQQADGVVVVQDNGVGFDPERAAEIFEPLARCHSKDQFEGSGIGLATVYRIAERHRGRVWARSAPAGANGATFWLDMGR